MTTSPKSRRARAASAPTREAPISEKRRPGAPRPAQPRGAGRRGRPKGSTGRAAVLTPAQIKQVLRLARARGRHAARAELALALSLGLGLRAKEIAALTLGDVYEPGGSVRRVLHLRAAYTKGGRTRDVFLSSPRLRRVLEQHGEERWLMGAPAARAPLLRSQKGGHMTAGSVARFLTLLYREAGVASASSHSGRRTLITGLAERGIDLKAIAEIAGHASIRTTAGYVEANPRRLARILQEVTW
jgi:integrase/recombinase XerD